jgi:hypothetical protein
VCVEFYSTAAQVIPVLLVVAALQSRLLSWAAESYVQGGIKRRFGQVVMYSIGGSVICEGIALAVLAIDKNWLTSLWWLRAVVIGGCLPALLIAWRGGHLEWMAKRDAAKEAQAAQIPAQQPQNSKS